MGKMRARSLEQGVRHEEDGREMRARCWKRDRYVTKVSAARDAREMRGMEKKGEKDVRCEIQSIPFVESFTIFTPPRFTLSICRCIHPDRLILVSSSLHKSESIPFPCHETHSQNIPARKDPSPPPPAPPPAPTKPGAAPAHEKELQVRQGNRRKGNAKGLRYIRRGRTAKIQLSQRTAR